MKKATGLVTIILIGLIISSCDKKNASLVNRRTATPEIIEEIQETQKAKEEPKQEEAQRAKEEPKQEETQKAKEERSTVTLLESEQVPEQTKEKESESGPNKSLAPVSITGQVSNPTEDKKLKSVSEPTKEEQPKQEPKDSVVIQPQHQLPPSVLAQASVTGGAIAVDDNDDNDSSSVPAAQPEALPSAQEQTPELVIEPSPVSASNPAKPGFVAKSVDCVLPPAEPVVVAEPEQELEQASELLPTLRAIEANTKCNDLKELSNKDETIKTELEHKTHENLEKSLEEKDKEEIERSKAEKKEIDERQKAKLKAEKEDRIAKLKEQGAQKRAQRAILRTEPERKTCEYEGLEELFDEEEQTEFTAMQKAEPEPVVVAEPEQELEQASELLPTLRAIEANTKCNDLKELSNKDETIKTELEHKTHENLEKSLEEKDKEEIERSKAEKKEIDERQKAKLKAEKEDRIAKLKEQGAQKRAQRAILRTEPERKTCEYEGLEELFDEGKTVVEAEEIKENREKSNAEKQMEEAEQQQRDRLNKEEQKRVAEFKAMQKAEEEQRRVTEFEAMQKAEEEQRRVTEFAAMQKAEEEQKTRLKERDKIWADYLARNSDLADYYDRHPIETQQKIDCLYKNEQEEKRRIEEDKRELEELKRETKEAKRQADEAKRHREETEREIDRLNEIIINSTTVKGHSKHSMMSVRQ